MNFYQWEALINFLREKRKEKKKIVRLPALVLKSRPSRFPIGPQSVYVSRALCIFVMQTQGSD